VKTAPHKPAKRGPAVIRSGEVYSLAELRRRLQWQEHALRMARAAGLRLVSFGRQKFVLGSDILEFFKRLGDRQQAPADSRSTAGRGEP
jgi:hypothetical protein